MQRKQGKEQNLPQYSSRIARIHNTTTTNTKAKDRRRKTIASIIVHLNKDQTQPQKLTMMMPFSRAFFTVTAAFVAVSSSSSSSSSSVFFVAGQDTPDSMFIAGQQTTDSSNETMTTTDTETVEERPVRIYILYIYILST